ncbi:twin-argninine leader-binding protein DmsD [Klebsiella pneumoniae]|nr:twin-argninine leader-binding protein DmsD [Klebsiella pneumoniae]
MPIPNRDAVALSARTLGALFSYAPNSAEIAPLVAAFQDGSWQQQWPFPVAAPLASGFAASAEETLPEAWQRLFIGPWALPAPPWGSVWLDKESVLFGDSTLALRQWMRENGIALEADGNEPGRSFRHRATPGGMVVRNGAGCVVCPAAGLAPAAVVRAFPERLCRPCRPPLLSDAGSAGAGDLWRSGRRICRSPWRKNRSIVNPSPRRYPARFYFAASQPFTRTYRFCI